MNDPFWGPACAFGASVTWAIGSTGYSRLSQNSSTFAVNFARALIALPLFFVATFLLSGGIEEGLAHFKEVRLEHWAWFTLSMTSSYGLGDSLFLMSARTLGVPGALAVASCYPVWTILGGVFIYHEPLSLVRTFGVVLTVLGIIVVVLNGPKKPRSSEPFESGAHELQPSSMQSSNRFPMTGFVLALATSVAWATNSYAVSRGAADLFPAVGNTIRMILALILSAGFGFLLNRGAPLLLPVGAVKGYLWIFFIEAFVGSYFYLYGLSHSPLALGATLSSLAPVVSVPVAVLFGLEQFSWVRTLGVALAVTGIWLLVT